MLLTVDSRYLASLKLSDASVLDMWGGLQYLALEAEPFLRVQSLVNRAAELFPELESCLVLHQGQLVWSEIEPGVTRLLGELSVIRADRRTDGKDGWGTNHHNQTDLVIHYPNRNCKHTHLSENVN